MNIIKWILGLFSPYVNSEERRADKFFKKIKSTSNSYEVKKKLLKLMQKDLVSLNIWLEKKFKGYHYLKKSTRKKIYQNRNLMVDNFYQFFKKYNFSEQIKDELSEIALAIPPAKLEEVEFLRAIMEFLKPGKLYHYLEGVSFGKLFLNSDKYIGDCNQIVTLYIYLFSLKFPIEQLKIKLLPGHVCLHFSGIDIEATNGSFKKYKEYEEILPVTEIISTNLLDILDKEENVINISPNDILKSSQFAYAISSLKSLVSKNLKVAYQNLGIKALEKHDFQTAIFYFEKNGDQNLIRNAFHNAAIYFLKKKNYRKAKYYAEKKGDLELVKEIEKSEKIDEFNKLNAKVKNIKLLTDAKKHKKTYRKMLNIARFLDDDQLEKNLRETLNKL